jgi:DNA-binding transcriptional LysR family regulator
MTMDWDKLRVFHAVAEAGSFTHAGEALNLSQSAVSRQIGALEESLQVPLFHRHARGLMPTEQGEILFRTAREILAKLNMAEARILESRERPKGPLKVTTTIAFGSVWLAPRLKEFLDVHPEIELTLVLTDNELDLSMRQADVAIRMTAPTQSDLVQRRLMTLRYHVFAAPSYLQKHGMPRKPEDLDEHRLIVFGEDARPPLPALNWLLEVGTVDGVKRKAFLKVNSTYGIFRAVQSGIGIGALPHYLNEETGNLVQILPELRGPDVGVYFVYPDELRHSNRIALFRDFVLGKVEELAGT